MSEAKLRLGVEIWIYGGIRTAQDRSVMHTSVFRVRQYECDAYGHLNNVNYVRYLQEAIVEANAAAGYTLARPSAAGWRWRTRRLDIEYLRPVRYGDTVELQVSAPAGAAGFVCRGCEFRLAGSGDLVAQAVVEAVPVDAASGQPVELPQTVSDEQPDPAAALPRLPPPPPGVFSVRHRVTWGDLDMSRQVGDATLLSYVETCGFGVIARASLARGAAWRLRDLPSSCAATKWKIWRLPRWTMEAGDLDVGFQRPTRPLPRAITLFGGADEGLC